MNSYGSYGNSAGNLFEWGRGVFRSMARGDSGSLLKVGFVFLAITILIFLFPRVVGWAVGLIFLLISLWFFRMAWHAWRAERRWHSARIYETEDFYEVL